MSLSKIFRTSLGQGWLASTLVVVTLRHGRRVQSALQPARESP